MVKITITIVLFFTFFQFSFSQKNSFDSLFVIPKLDKYISYSTIKIEFKAHIKYHGKDTLITSSRGTGFFLQLLKDSINKTAYHCIVTNKHVIYGNVNASEMWLKFNLADKNGKPIHGLDGQYIFTIKDFKERWINHTSDSVDLCLMSIHQITSEIKKIKLKLYYEPIDIDLIPSKKDWEGFSSLEDIIMTGYPNGIYDEINNMPISRKGLTATDVKLSYQGRKEFLVDVPIFPGSSGSPIFIYSRGTFVDSNNEIVFGNKLYLIGINYAGIFDNNIADINKNIFLNKKDFEALQIFNNVKISTRIFTNLGVAIRSDRLLELQEILRKELKIK